MHKRFKTITSEVFSQSFLKFLIVGAVNTFVDAGVFNAVLLLAVINPFELELIAGKSLGFIVASLNSYYLNARWTFNTSRVLTRRTYLLFMCVSVVGLLLNVAAAYSLYYVGHIFLPLHPLIVANIAFVGATLASLLWNYIGYKKFVFSV